MDTNKQQQEPGTVVGQNTNVDPNKPDVTVDSNAADQTTVALTQEQQQQTIDYSKSAVDQVEDLLVASGLDVKAVADYVTQAIFDKIKEAFADFTEQSGEESWKEINVWAGQNLEAQTRKDINELLQQGGYAAELAVNDLIQRFKTSNGMSVDAQLMNATQANNTGGLQPLSKVAYGEMFRKLEAEGHVYGQSKEMEKLDRQRQLGIEQGLI